MTLQLCLLHVLHHTHFLQITILVMIVHYVICTICINAKYFVCLIFLRERNILFLKGKKKRYKVETKYLTLYKTFNIIINTFTYNKVRLSTLYPRGSHNYLNKHSVRVLVWLLILYSHTLFNTQCIRRISTHVQGHRSKHKSFCSTCSNCVLIKIKL